MVIVTVTVTGKVTLYRHGYRYGYCYGYRYGCNYQLEFILIQGGRFASVAAKTEHLRRSCDFFPAGVDVEPKQAYSGPRRPRVRRLYN